MKKASFLARLGSGSACRSVKGKVVVWGNHADIDESSDLFGVEFPTEIHANFNNYQDTILLVDKGEKQVSSTVGHDLMHDHPYAEQRFAQAHDNLSKLKTVLETGDLEKIYRHCRKRNLDFTRDDDDFDAVFHFDETQHARNHQRDLEIPKSAQHSGLFYVRCWSERACFVSRKR